MEVNGSLVAPLVFKTSVGLNKVPGGFDSHSPPFVGPWRFEWLASQYRPIRYLICVSYDEYLSRRSIGTPGRASATLPGWAYCWYSLQVLVLFSELSSRTASARQMAR